MPIKKARKPAAKVSILTSFITITLSDEQQLESLIITPLINLLNKPTFISFKSFYLLKPFFIINNTKDTNNIELII
jgi:hypothetical protein